MRVLYFEGLFDILTRVTFGHYTSWIKKASLKKAKFNLEVVQQQSILITQVGLISIYSIIGYKMDL